jgi:hypothetical protein
MTQGASNGTAISYDLDALLASRLLEPAVVKLGGKDWQVRTDLTAIEATRCLAFTRSAEIPGAFTYLVGTRKDIAQLNAALADREKAEKDAKANGGTVAYTDLPYGQKAKELNSLLESMPRMHSALAQAHIFRASKALAEFAIADETIHRTYDYTPGESSAS